MIKYNKKYIILIINTLLSQLNKFQISILLRQLKNTQKVEEKQCNRWEKS